MSNVNPEVIRTEQCLCGAPIQLRAYTDNHLPPRWYNPNTDKAHSCPTKQGN